MPKSKWRRFLPKRTEAVVSHQPSDVFAAAREIVENIPARDFEAIDREIKLLENRMDETDATSWLALLILQAPRAAHAQAMMDENPHGYHDRTKRLYELIDFNDTFVSTVLLLPSEQLSGFIEMLRTEIDTFCKKMHSRTFSDEQYEAITHGLSREIAVYRAAQHAGLNALMTSRAADAFGIDMQIQSPETGKYLNVDCKTGSSFHFRLKDLVHQGRIAPHDQTDAETKGWWEIVNQDKDHRHVRIVLLRIDQDELGEIRDFGFVDSSAIQARLHNILEQRSISDGRFGTDFLEQT